jgi:hypothetical protein
MNPAISVNQTSVMITYATATLIKILPNVYHYNLSTVFCDFSLACGSASSSADSSYRYRAVQQSYVNGIWVIGGITGIYGSVVVYKSSDGGNTWSNATMLNSAVDPVPTTGGLSINVAINNVLAIAYDTNASEITVSYYDIATLLLLGRANSSTIGCQWPSVSNSQNYIVVSMQCGANATADLSMVYGTAAFPSSNPDRISTNLPSPSVGNGIPSIAVNDGGGTIMVLFIAPDPFNSVSAVFSVGTF